MVALNESFAPGKSALGSKNRVGNFFGRVAVRAGENCPATRNRIGEKRPTLTIIASGRPVWPSRDPMEELGGNNLYGFSGNNGVNTWDLLGLFFSSCSLISGPTVKQGAEWELEQVAPDIIGGTQGSFLYGFDVTWKIQGEVKCCCKTLGLFNERVETKSVKKTYERSTRLPGGGFPVYSPLNLPGGFPSAKTIGDAVNQLIASRLTIGTSFLLNPDIEGAQINKTVTNSKPSGFDAGEWPEDPCD